MKRSVLNQGGVRTWGCAMLAGLVLLSWPWPVAGGDKQAVQSVAIAVGYSPGALSVTRGGTIHIKGLNVVYMLLSEPDFLIRLSIHDIVESRSASPGCVHYPTVC